MVRDPMLNAFALPGGFIGVHSGLMIAAQNESELAGVLAHEIGHVSQRHIARMLGNQKDSLAIQIGALLLAILASRAGGTSGGDLAQAAIMGGQAAAIQQQLNFSREAEREADRVGFVTLVNASFDGRGIEQFFGRLQQGSRLYEGTAPAYLRTHPLTVERICDMQNRSRNLRSSSEPIRSTSTWSAPDCGCCRKRQRQGWRDQLDYFNRQLKNRTAASEAGRALWRRVRRAEAQHARPGAGKRARRAPRHHGVIGDSRQARSGDALRRRQVGRTSAGSASRWRATAQRAIRCQRSPSPITSTC